METHITIVDNNLQMKKFLNVMIAVVMVTAIGIGLTSCKGSDDDNSNNNPNTVLIGTWKYSFGNQGGYDILQINADGTCYTQEYDPQDGGWHSKRNATFTYDSAAKRCTIINDRGRKIVLQLVDNDTLVVIEGNDDPYEKYVRQK